MNDNERSITKLSLLLTAIFATVLVIVIWGGLENSKNSTIKPCEHWVYNYHFRGRMNKDVLCADSLYINDRGEYKELPWHLKEQQEEITKQYHFLMKRLYQADTAKANLPKPEE